MAQLYYSHLKSDERWFLFEICNLFDWFLVYKFPPFLCIVSVSRAVSQKGQCEAEASSVTDLVLHECRVSAGLSIPNPSGFLLQSPDLTLPEDY